MNSLLADSFLGCRLRGCSDRFQGLLFHLFLLDVVVVKLAAVDKELMTRQAFEFLTPCLLAEADHNLLVFRRALPVLNCDVLDLNLANVQVNPHWTIVFLSLCILKHVVLSYFILHRLVARHQL